MINFPLLQPEDILVKVKQVTKTGALLLLYKTARTDAKILDEVVGPLNWTDDYVEVKGNLYCRIGIREKEDQEFVYKMDCGIESDQDDGQEKKAEASDAFKRCASKLGIGRELYTSPQIWANVNTVQKGDKWYLEDRTAKYYVSRIKYDESSRTIIDLEIRNVKTGVVVYTMPLTKKVMSSSEDLDFGFDDVQMEVVERPKTTTTKSQKAEKSAEVKEPAEPVATEVKVDKPDLKTLVTEVGEIVRNLMAQEGSNATYKNIVKEVTGDTTFKCNNATDSDYDIVLAIRDKLVASGYRG